MSAAGVEEEALGDHHQGEDRGTDYPELYPEAVLVTEAGPQWLRAELDRLSRELTETSRQKIQAAEYGLAVLEEKHRLQIRHDDMETELEEKRRELDLLKEAFGHAHSTHRKVAEDGESREEVLILESASREAEFQRRVVELQAELRLAREELAGVQTDNQRLATLARENRESSELCELQRAQLRDDIREYKVREARLLQDYSELEDENICLQKQVSLLRQSQVELEGLKHEVLRVEEEAGLLQGQMEEALLLKEMAARQLAEALETLETERQQKAALRRELHHYMTIGDALCLGPAPPDLSLDGLRLGEGLENGVGVEKAGAKRGEAFRPAPSLVDDLLTELNISEIQKLKQQLLQVERDKAALASSLQESQRELEEAQGSLAEQQEAVGRLSQNLSAMRTLQASKEQQEQRRQEKEEGGGGGEGDYYELDIDGPEILRCKYTVAVAEGAELRRELKAVEAEYREWRGRGEEERARLEGRARELSDALAAAERSGREAQEEAARLARELGAAAASAGESLGSLNVAQDELTAFSEELANLYHHVCMCNNETPNRVMLDYYRHGRAGVGGGGGGGGEGPEVVAGAHRQRTRPLRLGTQEGRCRGRPHRPLRHPKPRPLRHPKPRPLRHPKPRPLRHARPRPLRHARPRP